MILTSLDAARFGEWLRDNEKSPATIAKYLRDVRGFLQFVQKRPAEKALMILFLVHLTIACLLFSHYSIKPEFRQKARTALRQERDAGFKGIAV